MRYPSSQMLRHGRPSSWANRESNRITHLSKFFDDHLKSQLESAAKRTLEQIDSSGWEAVSGKTKQEKAARVEILRRAAVVATPVASLASESMTWQHDDAALYEKEKAEVEGHFPKLCFVVENDLLLVRGSFAVMLRRSIN
jgi:hypothetical protein